MRRRPLCDLASFVRLAEAAATAAPCRWAAVAALLCALRRARPAGMALATRTLCNEHQLAGLCSAAIVQTGPGQKPSQAWNARHHWLADVMPSAAGAPVAAAHPVCPHQVGVCQPAVLAITYSLVNFERLCLQVVVCLAAVYCMCGQLCCICLCH